MRSLRFLYVFLNCVLLIGFASSLNAQSQSGRQSIQGLSIDIGPMATRCRFVHFPVFRRREPLNVRCSKVHVVSITELSGASRTASVFCGNKEQGFSQRAQFQTVPNRRLKLPIRSSDGPLSQGGEPKTCFIRVNDRSVLIY